MLNILINGINGKMGQEVFKEASSMEYCKVVCGVDKNTTSNLDINVYDDPSKIAEKVDVIIDFSIPKATFNILNYAKAKKIPIVIATTRIFRRRVMCYKKLFKFYSYI